LHHKVTNFHQSSPNIPLSCCPSVFASLAVLCVALPSALCFPAVGRPVCARTALALACLAAALPTQAAEGTAPQWPRWVRSMSPPQPLPPPKAATST
jgi:hypothetical protein